MQPTQISKNRTTAIVLAGLLLGAALVATPATAATMPSIRLEDTETVAGSAQVETFRQVYVHHDGGVGDPPIREIELKVPESGGQIKEEIVWEAATSSATGWGVTTDNSGNPNILRFTANGPSNYIQPTAKKAFNIGFSIKGDPDDGTPFSVSVHALFDSSAVPSGAVTYEITIDDTPPTVLPTGVITRDLFNGNTEAPNGKLDHLWVFFSEPLDPLTLAVEDLRVQGYEITAATLSELRDPGDELVAGKPEFGACPADSIRGCQMLDLTLAESFQYDTGALPHFTTTATNLKDIAGNRLSLIGTSTVTEVDGANPILVAALAKDLDDTNPDLEGIRVQFSERVRGTAALAVSCSEFVYKDNAAGGPQDPTCPNDWTITHPPGDAGPQQTDLVEIKFEVPLEPLREADFTSEDQDMIRCTDFIRDLSSSGPSGQGLPCLHAPEYDNDVAIEVPGLIDAEINIGQRKITATFKVGVSDAAGDTVAVKASSFDIVPTDGGGPQGIDQIEHEPCSNIVIIHLDQPAKPTDVDLTPSHLRIAEGRIKGCGSGAAKPLFVPAGDHRLDDQTPPTVMKASTVDENGNGVIDGFFLEFSEPVDDATFCQKQNPCPHLDCDFITTCLDFDPAAHHLIALRDPEGLLTLGPECFPSFEYDSDLAANDRFGIIKWAEPTCSQSPFPHLDTGFVPELVMGETVWVDLAGFPDSGNGMLVVDAAQLRETDGAAPILFSAHTVDRETRFDDEPTGRGTPCIVGEERRCEEDPDGFIDGYRLVFSEPVSDRTFDARHWKVAQHEVRGVATDHLEGDLVEDRTLVIAFSEATFDANGGMELRPNTDAKPQLTYTSTGTSSLDAFTDLSGNVLQPLHTEDIFEEDGARPVIVSVRGFVNQTVLNITFSEPVDDGVGKALVRSDFVYSNGNAVNPGTVQGDLAGLNDRTSGFDNTVPLEHKPGDLNVTIRLNRPLTAEDIAHDRVGANLESVRESTFSVVDKQHALTTFKPLNFSLDQVAPGSIDRVDLDLRRANAATLRWTAPGDDGQANDAVAGYVVKVSTAEITSFNDTEAFGADNGTKHVFGEGVDDLIVTFTPTDLVRPGSLQRMTLTGLDPETTYYAALRAYDHDRGPDDRPLMGPFDPAGMATFTTLPDDSPPKGQLQLRSTTHPANQPVLAMQASFQWDALTDEESQVLYHYRLDQTPDAEVTEEDARTIRQNVTVDVPGLGTWYFHVRGMSAGGQEASTTTYKIVVGHGSIDPLAIRDYNLALRDTVKVVREGTTNVVSWTLPDPKDLELGPMEAVRVWRMDEGAYTLIETKRGDYESLRVSKHVDDDAGISAKSHYMVDAVFATGQHDGDPSILHYPPVPVDARESNSIPTWVWILVAAAGLLLIGGIVAIAVVRARHVPPELAAGPGIDPETGLPSHQVRCPTCSHNFQAVGELPLEITCPECQTKGVIE